jgi:hypothetical protein
LYFAFEEYECKDLKAGVDPQKFQGKM